MQDFINSSENSSCQNTKSDPSNISENALLWEEYSSFHDAFTEMLSYENSRKNHSDLWQLHYI